MAARLRRELKTPVDMVHGRYGEFKVLVNDIVIVEGGPLSVLGVLPSSRRVVEAIQAHLSRSNDMAPGA